MRMFLLPERTLISEKEGQIIVGLRMSWSDHRSLESLARNRHAVRGRGKPLHPAD